MKTITQLLQGQEDEALDEEWNLAWLGDMGLADRLNELSQIQTENVPAPSGALEETIEEEILEDPTQFS